MRKASIPWSEIWDGWDDEWRRWSPPRVRRPDQSWLMIKINIACVKESLFSQSLFASHTDCFMVVGVIVHHIELWKNRYFGLKKEKVVIFPISWSRSHPHWGKRKKGEGRLRRRRVTSRHCYQFKTGNTSIVMNCNVARSEEARHCQGCPSRQVGREKSPPVLSDWVTPLDPGCRNINRYFLQIRLLCSSLCLILAAVCNAQHVFLKIAHVI